MTHIIALILSRLISAVCDIPKPILLQISLDFATQCLVGVLRSVDLRETYRQARPSCTSREI